MTFWTLHVRDFHVIPSHSHHTKATSRLHHSDRTAWTNVCDPVCFAIVDSGTSYSYAPPQLYESIVRHITAGLDCSVAADATILCIGTELADFPTLSFSFGLDAHDGSYFLLRPRSYVYCENTVCEVQLRNHAYVHSVVSVLQDWGDVRLTEWTWAWIPTGNWARTSTGGCLATTL